MTATNNATVANTGNDNGSTILKKILKSPAPSMRAASNKLCGNPSIKERMIIRLKALINVGRIYTQNDPIRCKSLIRRKDRKSTRLNSSHVAISYAVFCLKKKKKTQEGVRSQECEDDTQRASSAHTQS